MCPPGLVNDPLDTVEQVAVFRGNNTELTQLTTLAETFTPEVDGTRGIADDGLNIGGQAPATGEDGLAADRGGRCSSGHFKIKQQPQQLGR